MHAPHQKGRCSGYRRFYDIKSLLRPFEANISLLIQTMASVTFNNIYHIELLGLSFWRHDRNWFLKKVSFLQCSFLAFLAKIEDHQRWTSPALWIPSLTCPTPWKCAKQGGHWQSKTDIGASEQIYILLDTFLYFFLPRPADFCSCFAHTSYLSFLLHGQDFWKIKFTPNLHSKLPIYTVNCQFTQ